MVKRFWCVLLSGLLLLSLSACGKEETPAASLTAMEAASSLSAPEPEPEPEP